MAAGRANGITFARDGRTLTAHAKGEIVLAAGAIGGAVDEVLMRVVDVLLAIPALLLSLSVVILLGFGTTSAAIAVGVTSIAVFARLARSRVVSVRVCCWPSCSASRPTCWCSMSRPTTWTLKPWSCSKRFC